MPFLWLTGQAQVDEVELAGRLCPYVGRLERVDQGATRLWHSAITSWVSPALELPVLPDSKRVHRSACSAFGRVEVLDDGARFSTDALGTLPLWKLTRPGFTAISPEAKAFAAIDGVSLVLKPSEALLAAGERPIDWSPYDDVERLPPGSSWETRGGVWAEVKRSPWPMLLATTGDSTDTRELGDALEHALDGLDDLSRAGAFISGGIDSSIAAALLRFKARPLRTWSLGTRVGNEFAHAAELASHLESQHHELQLHESEVRGLWSEVIRSNEVSDGMTAEIVLQLAALVEEAGHEVTDVATGYGADLLFGGMLRHEAYLQAVGVRTTRALIARTLWTGELSPFYAWKHGVAVHPVFWSPAVIRAALSLDPTVHFDGTHEKVPLRKLALTRGWLTEPLAFRPKVGMTVGTAAYQLVAEQLGLTNVMDYEGRSRLAVARLLLELEKHTAS